MLTGIQVVASSSVSAVVSRVDNVHIMDKWPLSLFPSVCLRSPLYPLVVAPENMSPHWASVSIKLTDNIMFSATLSLHRFIVVSCSVPVFHKRQFAANFRDSNISRETIYENRNRADLLTWELRTFANCREQEFGTCHVQLCTSAEGKRRRLF